MPTRDDILKRTHLDAATVTRRVYDTLTEPMDHATDRTALLLSLLIERMSKRGDLARGDIDDLLVDLVG